MMLVLPSGGAATQYIPAIRVHTWQPHRLGTSLNRHLHAGKVSCTSSNSPPVKLCEAWPSDSHRGSIRNIARQLTICLGRLRSAGCKKLSKDKICCSCSCSHANQRLYIIICKNTHHGGGIRTISSSKHDTKSFARQIAVGASIGALLASPCPPMRISHVRAREELERGNIMSHF